MVFLLAVLIQAKALGTMVLWPELLGDPLAEGAGVRVLFCLLWRGLLLGHLGRARAILCALRRGEDGVGYVDRKAARLSGGVSGLRGFVIAVQAVAVLAAENLSLELLEVGALLRHGGQQDEGGG